MISWTNRNRMQMISWTNRCDPPDEWKWQTRVDTFVRTNHLSYTFTHLGDALTQISPTHNMSPDSMYPVYVSGEVAPPALGQSH
jgi:hypothetical protein